MIALQFQRAIQDARSYISNPYANYYQLRPGVWNYHPGIDVLFQEGSIAHCPVKAVSWMTVTYAQRCLVPGFEAWGNLIVGRCELPNGKQLYCRYAHVENMLVKVGQIVHPGQHIADVGNAYGVYVYHLDFSISPTKLLAITPWDWPGLDLQRVYDNYIDPKRFIEEHSQMADDFTSMDAAINNQEAATADLKAAWAKYKAEPEPLPDGIEATVASNGTRVRSGPTTQSSILTTLDVNTALLVIDSGIDADTHRWMKITFGPAGSVGGYVAKDLLNFL